MDNEKEIIKNVIKGRTDDFAALILAHQGKVFSICLSLLRSPTEAEDAAQEVFVRAYRNLSKFRFEASFSTWLYRIAYNLCADMLKDNAGKKQVAIMRDIEEPVPDGVNAEDRLLIGQTLAGLPADYRAILVMREGTGMSYAEIASATDISIEAVRCRLRRARVMLAEAGRDLLERGKI